MIPIDQRDQGELARQMTELHRAEVMGMLQAGYVPPWMDLDLLADQDEMRLMTEIADHGPVALGVNANRALADRLKFVTVANMRATIGKAQAKGLTEHSIRDGVEIVNMTLYGRYVFDIKEADDGED